MGDVINFEQAMQRAVQNSVQPGEITPVIFTPDMRHGEGFWYTTATQLGTWPMSSHEYRAGVELFGVHPGPLLIQSVPGLTMALSGLIHAQTGLEVFGIDTPEGRWNVEHVMEWFKAVVKAATGAELD